MSQTNSGAGTPALPQPGDDDDDRVIYCDRCREVHDWLADPGLGEGYGYMDCPQRFGVTIRPRSASELRSNVPSTFID